MNPFRREINRILGLLKKMHEAYNDPLMGPTSAVFGILVGELMQLVGEILERERANSKGE